MKDCFMGNDLSESVTLCLPRGVAREFAPNCSRGRCSLV